MTVLGGHRYPIARRTFGPCERERCALSQSVPSALPIPWRAVHRRRPEVLSGFRSAPDRIGAHPSAL
ncbi:unnamed protein product [Leptosia nina]|uniref:Uncharacterized protein n=1 Tax=Leptosia nina TaxID=320188 RepID=A0AAV1J5W1_9NEOP